MQDRIRELGKTQKELATLFGVDPGQISKLFANPRPTLTPRRAKILAEFLEIPMEEVERLIFLVDAPEISRAGNYALRDISRPVESLRAPAPIPADRALAGIWGAPKVESVPPKPKTVQFRTDQDAEGRAVATITIKAATDIDTVRLALRLMEAAKELEAKAKDEGE
jgi:transcriptional regulator with XRE-family HTH domain